MIVMLSVLVLVGMVMNHISLLGDPLWVTDTQPDSFGVLASVLSFSFVSLCSPPKSEH